MTNILLNAILMVGSIYSGNYYTTILLQSLK